MFDHAAKQNQSQYPWAQNIVAIGLLKIVKGRWACLPLNQRYYLLEQEIKVNKPTFKGKEMVFQSKHRQAVDMLSQVAMVFAQSVVKIVTDSWFGNNGPWRPLGKALGQSIKAKTIGYSAGEIFFDMSQVTDHRLPHMLVFDSGELKHQRQSDVHLLISGLTAIELPCLTVVAGEALSTNATFLTGFWYGGALKSSGRRLAKRAIHKRVRLIENSFRDSLVIERGDSFPKDEILVKRRAVPIFPQKILIIGIRHALVGGGYRVHCTGSLVQLATGALCESSLSAEVFSCGCL